MLTWFSSGRLRKSWVMIIIVCGLVSSMLPVSIQASSSDRRELLEAIDEYMNRAMVEHHVPGAVVSIVEDGEVKSMRGYGYADLERKIKADPNTTVFRLGSLSKSVTATAVMKLHEEGKVDLHKDIKEYDENLPLTYSGSKPVTMHELLTHTSGLCESVFGVGRHKEKQLPLGEAIHNEGFPAICREPGEQVAYSNQGMGLAGYLVEVISGKSYEQFVLDRIFKPLEMTHSAFRFEESDPHLAKSYAYDDNKGVYSQIPYSYINYLPAGGLNSTARDMARFMLAHLEQGEVEGGRILTGDSIELMHRTQFTAHENMPGVAYGFYERIHHDLRLVEHDGGIDGFQSYMYLIPSERTGIFIATNAEGGSEVREGLIQEYLKRAHPDHQKAEPSLHPTALHELQKVEGYYVPNRAKLKGPLNFGQHLSAGKLKAVKDGVITWGGVRFVETESYLFQAEDTGERIYIDAGQQRFALSSIPTMMYERQAGVTLNPLLHIIILLSFALVYPVCLILSALRELLGLIRRRKSSIDGMHIVISVLFIVYYLFILSIGELLVDGIPWWAHLVFRLPILLLLSLAVRIAYRLVRKQKIRASMYWFAGVTAGFAAYLYSWSFFSL